jgi:hypothetical protein
MPCRPGAALKAKVKREKIAQKFEFEINTLLARPKRFELLTPRFVVWCSIQLSYGRVFRFGIGLESPDTSGTCPKDRERAL